MVKLVLLRIILVACGGRHAFFVAAEFAMVTPCTRIQQLIEMRRVGAARARIQQRWMSSCPRSSSASPWHLGLGWVGEGTLLPSCSLDGKSLCPPVRHGMRDNGIVIITTCWLSW